jgi:hypothetical protein
MQSATRIVRHRLRLGFTLSAVLGVTIAACISQAKAATIVAPVTASAATTFISSSGNDYSILNTIDQSGLSLGYVSGETDFSSYLAGNPTHTSRANGNEWFSRDYGTRRLASQTVTYGFSALTSIDAFALWNEEFAGIGTTQLLSSVDGHTYTSLGTVTPMRSTFAPGNTIIPYSAQVFSFDLTSMLFFRLVIANCPGPPSSQSSYRGCGIGEVAFSAVLRPVGNNPIVPLPAALPLLASALGLFAWMGRRRKSHASPPERTIISAVPPANRHPAA